MIKTLASKIVRVLFGAPVYLIDPRNEYGFAFYGPKRIANLIKRFGSGHFDTAPHEGGLCDFLAQCDECAVPVQYIRAASNV